MKKDKIKFCSFCGSKLEKSIEESRRYNSETGLKLKLYMKKCPNGQASAEGWTHDIFSIEK